MKSLSPTSCLCVLSLALASCQSFSVPAIQSRLGSLDFNLDSSDYIVRAGETLETIAFRYKTTVSALRQLNPHAREGVYTGMRLSLRQASGVVPQVTRNAAWSDNQRPANDTPPVIAPAPSRQAVPLVATASEQYLLGRERFNSNRTQYPPVTQRPTQLPQGAYTEPRGFPVEEVIDDENFVLPDASGDDQDAEQGFVGGWQWPLNGKLAREYDLRRPNGRGIEIVGLPGQDVYATRDGVVDWVARSPDGVGKVIIVRHDDDYLSIYSNAQELNVGMKESVQQGQSIAILGANANDEPLLRFEISKGGNMLNPIDFLTPR
ncbi:MAG: peptidoglycan DD-metalloendopeptidase family protein [Granulosicoccus sp.]